MLESLLQSLPVASAAAVPAASGGWLSNLGNALSGTNWAGVLGSGLAGYAASKYDQEIEKQKYAQNKAELALERKNAREVAAAKAQTDYFQNRTNRERKRQGVSSFRQFVSGG